MIIQALFIGAMMLFSLGYPVWYRRKHPSGPPKCFRSQPQGEEMLTNGCARCVYDYHCLTLGQRLEARSLEYQKEVDQ